MILEFHSLPLQLARQGLVRVRKHEFPCSYMATTTTTNSGHFGVILEYKYLFFIQKNSKTTFQLVCFTIVISTVNQSQWTKPCLTWCLCVRVPLITSFHSQGHVVAVVVDVITRSLMNSLNFLLFRFSEANEQST